MITCKPIVRLSLADFIKPIPGVVPPSGRLLHNSIRSAPAFCASMADSTLSVHISILNSIAKYNNFLFPADLADYRCLFQWHELQTHSFWGNLCYFRYLKTKKCIYGSGDYYK